MASLIDRIVGWFRGRSAKKRAYEGAGYGPRLKNFVAKSTSANREIAESLATLRDRSRKQVRDNMYFKRAIESITNNVVGDGIMPSIYVDNQPKLEQRIKKAFYAWAKKCEFTQGQSLWALQAQIMQAVAESGEVLILKKLVSYKKGEVPLKLSILESDQLDHTKGFVPTEGGGYIRFGVEFDAEGRRVAYWIWPKHPGETGIGSYASVRVPASDVIHVYQVLRPGQVRGVPFGAACIVRANDLKDYEEAQLVRQKIAACLAIFVQRHPDTVLDTDDDGEPLEKVAPGMIEYLQPGETVTFAVPPGVDGYDEYMKRSLQAIAAGFGITYEMLAQDLSNVNFSSGRMGWIEASRNIARWQRDLMIPALDAIWEWWNELAIVAGLVTKTYEVSWTTPRREMLDPVKESKAVSDMLANGLISYPEALRQMGYDPDDVVAEIEDWNKKIKEAGLTLAWDPSLKAQAPPTAPTDQPDEETDPENAQDDQQANPQQQ